MPDVTQGDLHIHPYSVSDIVIIGGGASGVLLALHLARRGYEGSLTIISDEVPGNGPAYRTRSRDHVLNVPAHNMGAYHDDPGHFHAWVSASGDGIGPDDFVPRFLFGDYLRQLLAASLAQHPNWKMLRDRAVDISPGPSRTVLLASGQRVAARQIVLATGNRAAADIGLSLPGAVHAWGYEGALEDLSPQAGILIIGTGLSMVDMVVSLAAKGHRGRITALSRRGLLPQPHASSQVAQPVAAPAPAPLRQLLRQFRALAHQQNDWRPVMDAWRPHWATVWQHLSPAEQARFLRHLRPWWDNFRHRIAPDIARHLHAIQQNGQLSIIAARILAAHRDNDGRLKVTYRPRGQSGQQDLTCDRIILAVGAESPLPADEGSLYDRLHRQGLVRADRHGLGIAADSQGRVLDAAGQASDWLFTLGPPLRGTVWETTAIPDIRRQAAALSELFMNTQGEKL